MFIQASVTTGVGNAAAERWKNKPHGLTRRYGTGTEGGRREKRGMGRGKPKNQSGAEHSLAFEPTGISPERKREQCSEYRVQMKKQCALYSAHFIPSLSGE